MNHETPSKEVLRQLKKNLNTLRRRETRYAGNAPLDLLNQIEDHVQAIDLTEQAIAGSLTEAAWREALNPLLVAIDGRTAVAVLTAPPRDKNLTILLDNVRQIWVEDYLDNALLNAIYLDLGLHQKQDAVPHPFEELNIRRRQPAQAEQELPPGTRAIDVYRQAGGGQNHHPGHPGPRFAGPGDG
ncbi:MAG: hypothetical protein R3264_11450 [Anaerolineae bacterium]|nr:hypothetical protein [Anaerolineae bacterium]